MSKIMEVDETAATSSADHNFGSSKDVEKGGGFLARIKGQRVDLNELGKEYFQQALQYDEEQLKRDAVKVRRKLDFIVLPMVSVFSFFSFFSFSNLFSFLLILSFPS